MENRECGNCIHFCNGDDCDYCKKHKYPVECYDSACDDFEDANNEN